MLQAYEGHFESESGRFFPIGQPVNTRGRHRAIITILNEPSKDEKTVERLAALDEFYAEIEASDEEVPEFERVKFREAEDI
jgi:hypothetical protein